MSDKSEKSESRPDVYKETELDTMIELIGAGVWRTTNLAKALHVDMDTVTKWKKRDEVKHAHRKAILKFAKRRTDVEKILSELDFESTPDPNNEFNFYMNLSDEQLDKLITTKARQAGVVEALPGEGETQEV